MIKKHFITFALVIGAFFCHTVTHSEPLTLNPEPLICLDAVPAGDYLNSRVSLDDLGGVINDNLKIKGFTFISENSGIEITTLELQVETNDSGETILTSKTVRGIKEEIVLNNNGLINETPDSFSMKVLTYQKPGKDPFALETFRNWNPLLWGHTSVKPLLVIQQDSTISLFTFDKFGFFIPLRNLIINGTIESYQVSEVVLDQLTGTPTNLTTQALVVSSSEEIVTYDFINGEILSIK